MTWNEFLSWAFGPRRLAVVAVLVDEAKRRAEFLREVPESVDVQRQLGVLLRKICTEADGNQLRQEADLASALADLAAWPELPAVKAERLVAGTLLLERMIGRRFANLALLRRYQVVAERAAA